MLSTFNYICTRHGEGSKFWHVLTAIAPSTVFMRPWICMYGFSLHLSLSHTFTLTQHTRTHSIIHFMTVSLRCVTCRCSNTEVANCRQRAGRQDKVSLSLTLWHARGLRSFSFHRATSASRPLARDPSSNTTPGSFRYNLNSSKLLSDIFTEI